jgi:hypothetical protein
MTNLQQTISEFGGVDPGFSGALATISPDGLTLAVVDMPVTSAETDRQREIDLLALAAWVHARGSAGLVGLEWPTTRPGEGAERSERFGRGKGYLEAFLFAYQISYEKLAPNKWKGRLGLPGKDNPQADFLGAELLRRQYPGRADPLIVGPRGGLLSGRIDALCIAHYMRVQRVGGMRTVVGTYGKDSPQAMELIFAGRKTSRRPGQGRFF